MDVHSPKNGMKIGIDPYPNAQESSEYWDIHGSSPCCFVNIKDSSPFFKGWILVVSGGDAEAQHRSVGPGAQRSV